MVIGLLAVFLLGPERLPEYAAKLARLIKQLRVMADGAKDRMREEMGPEFDEVDWKKLDPRQYDPRRIIRDALLEEQPSPTALSPNRGVELPAAGAGATSRSWPSPIVDQSAPLNFDSEAT
ncbi:Sec-independent protein translocase TatB [Lysinibacter sp. HNR]|uniref:Sec-independent protein translocase TatB n=1 Tax=Lysinibacter sp. HNR TaxID=3031408 RepID=UPI0024358787|nr:Sec-independent protein translocase TatB [Lysinibacter sp. HNR]WGD38606.1 Sec-independent protein translocase TatB [Lysinibacter sp. HNR]